MLCCLTALMMSCRFFAEMMIVWNISDISTTHTHTQLNSLVIFYTLLHTICCRNFHLDGIESRKAVNYERAFGKQLIGGSFKPHQVALISWLIYYSYAGFIGQNNADQQLDNKHRSSPFARLTLLPMRPLFQRQTSNNKGNWLLLSLWWTMIHRYTVNQ